MALCLRLSDRPSPRPTCFVSVLVVVVATVALLGPLVALAERAEAFPSTWSGGPAARVGDAPAGATGGAGPSGDAPDVVADANVSPNSVIANVPVDIGPLSPAYDSSTNVLYVTNTLSDAVYVVSGTTNEAVAAVGVGSEPEAPTYDPANGYVYVVNSDDNNVSVISSAVNVVIGNPAVGNNPQVPTYDPANGEVYVANGADSDVTVLEGYFAVATILTDGVYPGSLTYDAANGDLYAPNTEFSNVTVISGATDKVVGAVDTGEFPGGVTYDAATGDLYVSAGCGGVVGCVTVISGKSNTALKTLSVGDDPQTPLYDPANGDVYVSNAGSDNISVISGTSNTLVATLSAGSEPASGTYDPVNGEVYVPNYGGNVTVIQGSTDTELPSIPVGADAQTPTYDAANADLYVSSWDYDVVSVIAGGVTVQVDESGLAGGTLWSATFGGVLASSSGATIEYVVTPGEYSYLLGAVSGYSVSPSGGTALVGASVYTLPVTFTSSAPPTFAVTIEENGLPVGTSWSAIFGGTESTSSTGSIGFTVAAGSYDYQILGVAGYTASPSGGTASVGAAYLIDVSFTATTSPSYTVTIDEAGLPTGTSWSAIFGGTEAKGTTATVTFSVTEGTYAYQILAVPGYSVSPSAGTATVNGTYLIDVTYASTASLTYTVTIDETGLPAGTSWSAIFGGTEASSTTTSVTFTVAGGSYAYQVLAAGTYSPSPASGTANVGGAYLIDVAFATSSPTSAPSTQVSVVGYSEGFTVAIAIAATALGFGLAAVVLSRRPRPPASGDHPPSQI